MYLFETLNICTKIIPNYHQNNYLKLIKFSNVLANKVNTEFQKKIKVNARLSTSIFFFV